MHNLDFMIGSRRTTAWRSYTLSYRKDLFSCSTPLNASTVSKHGHRASVGGKLRGSSTRKTTTRGMSRQVSLTSIDLHSLVMSMKVPEVGLEAYVLISAAVLATTSVESRRSGLLQLRAAIGCLPIVNREDITSCQRRSPGVHLLR
jgi:hypothetical protein